MTLFYFDHYFCRRTGRTQLKYLNFKISTYHLTLNGQFGHVGKPNDQNIAMIIDTYYVVCY